MCFTTFTGKVHYVENERDGIKGPTHGTVFMLPSFCKRKQEAEVVAGQLHSQTEDTFAPWDIRRVDKGATELRGLKGYHWVPLRYINLVIGKGD